MWMAHHLLRVNGFAPPWIEESKDIDAAVSRLRADLRTANGRRPAAIDEFRSRAAELNRRILIYNLKSPSAQLHKWPLDIEAEIRAAEIHRP
jgi:hypothetical protein